jgi:hypothetical protein
MNHINYDAGATLEKFTVRQHKPGEYVIQSSDWIWNGTLAGCVREYLEKPDSQKPLYNILVEPEAGTGKTILDCRDIDELAKRADFPAVPL